MMSPEATAGDHSSSHMSSSRCSMFGSPQGQGGQVPNIPRGHRWDSKNGSRASQERMNMITWCPDQLTVKSWCFPTISNPPEPQEPMPSSDRLVPTAGFGWGAGTMPPKQGKQGSPSSACVFKSPCRTRGLLSGPIVAPTPVTGSTDGFSKCAMVKNMASGIVSSIYPIAEIIMLDIDIWTISMAVCRSPSMG